MEQFNAVQYGLRSTPVTEGWVNEPLTPREREVMACLSQRMMDREIAASLQVSINTVKHHLRNIYSKFGVGSRRQAVDRYRVAMD
ncbi:MAG TPA: helix-turn-helix transcriptional regulator [Solimonas sp.]|nr:helix-turn-helix transcriptional regulator [Solimonas sp.]